MELKEFCQKYTSYINEKIIGETEKYFLGSQLTYQVHGQIEENERKLYYSVIKEFFEKHQKIINKYIKHILKLKEDNQAYLATIWAIRDLFERGILSPREDRRVEVLSGEEDMLNYFLAISNHIVKKGVDEDDLALLDQVDFSDCGGKKVEKLLSEICESFHHIRSLYSQMKEEEINIKKEVEIKIEEVVNYLANKRLVKFKGKALKERLQEWIKIASYSLAKNFKINTLDYTRFLIKQVFGQNLLFEILAFTKFIKFGFLTLPKCRIRKRRYEDTTKFEDIVEFDMLVLVEELKYRPILLVEVTTRGNIQNLEDKIRRIKEAYELLKEEFSNETFIPLLISCKESVKYMKEKNTDIDAIDKSIMNGGEQERVSTPTLVVFDFDEFFSHEINSKEKFLDELKKRCRVQLV
ncbi:MAG: hypothetical protein QW695_05565 [Candidatus Bathyarchaeia archaeon]